MADSAVRDYFAAVAAVSAEPARPVAGDSTVVQMTVVLVS